MKRFARARVLALAGVAAVLVVGAGVAGTAGEAKIVSFTATYAGLATVKVLDDIGEIAANGAGTATLMGKSKVTGKGFVDAAQRPCPPFTGTGSFFNATGTKISFKVLPGSQGCGDEDGQVFSLSGRVQITSGTKAYKKAKGSLKFTGVFDRGKGTFRIKFTGKVTVP